MDKFGFIISRHVNSEKTNNYWNHSVKMLRRLYPFCKIVIIDDNSNYNFVKADHEYNDIQIIQSEFPKRGELLPYYYYLKNRFFKNAIIIHDSVFFHKRINFELYDGIDVLPLWHFNSDKENVYNTARIIKKLRNRSAIEAKLLHDNYIMKMKLDKWCGCYGVQCYISLNFLERLENRYGITNLLSEVNCRSDRCCLERIFGAIFFTECPNLFSKKSLFGNIMTYDRWGYTYDEYMKDLNDKKLPRAFIKVWTGR